MIRLMLGRKCDFPGSSEMGRETEGKDRQTKNLNTRKAKSETRWKICTKIKNWSKKIRSKNHLIKVNFGAWARFWISARCGFVDVSSRTMSPLLLLCFFMKKFSNKLNVPKVKSRNTRLR